jgi:hypothetical protein
MLIINARASLHIRYHIILYVSPEEVSAPRSSSELGASEELLVGPV